MTDRPADARAFSRPAPKAREKRPGDEVGIFPTSLTGDVTSEIAEDDWERGWKKAREGSRSSHDEIFLSGHPFSFQLPPCRAQCNFTSLFTPCVTSYKNLLWSRDMFVGSAFQFGFLSCQEFTYLLHSDSKI